MKIMWVVMLKELRDLMRDRRMVMIALISGPILLPALVLGLFAFTEKRMATQTEKMLDLPVIGAEHAPNLVNWLQGQNIRVTEPPADPEQAIRDQDEDVILRIGADFEADWRGSRPALIELLHDGTRQNAQIPVNRVAGLLEQYSRQVGALRLLARGVDPNVGSPLRVSRQDLASEAARRGMLLGIMLPYMLIITALIGVSYVTIDVTAGERERQSLEPLLATPASREAIVSGKIAAACAFGFLSLLLILLGLKVGFHVAPPGRMQLDLSFLAIAKVLLVLSPIVLLGGTLLTLISATVKSVKEASSYMSLLMIVPLIPVMLLMVNPVKTQPWMFAVPFLAQNQLIGSVVRGEVVGALEWAIFLGAGLGLAALLWAIAARLYHREKLAISA
jgi:sodium transport system permease protein